MGIIRFGELLRSKREAAGLSRKELAEKAGQSERGLIKWELGEREPSGIALAKLVQALGANCEEFQAALLADDPDVLPERTRGRPAKPVEADELPAPVKKPGRLKKKA